MSNVPRAAVAAVAAAIALVVVPIAPTASAQAMPIAPSGVDVAGHQRPGGAAIDWNAVAADGQRYAFVKATEGRDWINQYYFEDIAAAQQAGLLTGSYHYARPASDPVVQAEHFANTISQAPALSLPPVLDLEVSEGLTPSQLQDWTRTFLGEVQARTGKTPMIYTYRYFWSDHMGNTSEFSNYPLWLAAYQNHAPKPIGGWDTIDFWQRSESGSVAGINTPVDMNLYNGHDAQLNAFSAGQTEASGGVLELMQGPEVPELNVLGQDSAALVAAIFATVMGVADGAALTDAAAAAGFDAEDAGNIAATVQQQWEAGALPVEDLQNLAVGDYNIGDLLILLENVNHTMNSPAN